jgi:hypothetical protein
VVFFSLSLPTIEIKEECINGNAKNFLSVFALPRRVQKNAEDQGNAAMLAAWQALPANCLPACQQSKFDCQILPFVHVQNILKHLYTLMHQ